MQKPIIAATLSGLFIKTEPWKNAHRLWFQEAADKLEDDSILEWMDKPNYFEGVDQVMKRLYPDLVEGQRTRKARDDYFDAVIKYIQQAPDMVNDNVVIYFRGLKKNFRLALITTNTEDSLNKLLAVTGLVDFFDIITASLPSEKDDKSAVMARFLRENNHPIVYIGGSRKETYDLCRQENISAIFANFEGEEDLKEVVCVHSLEELNDELNKQCYTASAK